MPPFIAIIEKIEKFRAAIQRNAVNPDAGGQFTRSVGIKARRTILTLPVIRLVAQEEAVLVFFKTVESFEYCFVQAGEHLISFDVDNPPDFRPVLERDFEPVDEVSISIR